MVSRFNNTSEVDSTEGGRGPSSDTSSELNGKFAPLSNSTKSPSKLKLVKAANNFETVSLTEDELLLSFDTSFAAGINQPAAAAPKLKFLASSLDYTAPSDATSVSIEALDFSLDNSANARTATQVSINRSTPFSPETVASFNDTATLPLTPDAASTFSVEDLEFSTDSRFVDESETTTTMPEFVDPATTLSMLDDTSSTLSQFCGPTTLPNEDLRFSGEVSSSSQGLESAPMSANDETQG